jgi:hypothetical protein
MWLVRIVTAGPGGLSYSMYRWIEETDPGQAIRRAYEDSQITVVATQVICGIINSYDHALESESTL